MSDVPASNSVDATVLKFVMSDAPACHAIVIFISLTICSSCIVGSSSGSSSCVVCVSCMSSIISVWSSHNILQRSVTYSIGVLINGIFSLFFSTVLGNV